MEIVDMTGEPRSDEDLRDAINAVNVLMVKHPTVLPSFTIHAGIIKDCLLELQTYRKVIAEIKLKKESDK